MGCLDAMGDCLVHPAPLEGLPRTVARAPLPEGSNLATLPEQLRRLGATLVQNGYLNAANADIIDRSALALGRAQPVTITDKDLVDTLTEIRETATRGIQEGISNGASIWRETLNGIVARARRALKD